MKTMLSLQTLRTLILGPVVLAASSTAAVASDGCLGGETTLFSCELTSRFLSLCQSGADRTTTGMRFQLRNLGSETVTQYPSTDTHELPTFEESELEYSKSTSRQISFTTDSQKFTIFSERSAMDGDDAGLIVRTARGVDVAHCKDGTVVDNLIAVDSKIRKVERQQIPSPR